MRLISSSVRPAIGTATRFGAQAGRQHTGGLGAIMGSAVALVTPFRNGRVDGGAFSRLCERQVRRGSTALVVCGSTGEAAALSITEHGRVVAMATEAACGRVPVIAGCGAPATEGAVHLAISAARHGADGLLCAPPPYTRPTQAGIAAHVRAIAQATDLPIVLYDVPSRTGVGIADITVAQLFESGVIVGIKDATDDLCRPGRLRAACGPDLVQLTGNDGTSAAYLAMGGHGCVSVTANLVPALCAGLHEAWRDGDLAAFGRIRDLLAPLHAALFNESNPIPVKAALDLVGLCEGELRLPLTRAGSDTLGLLTCRLAELMAAEGSAAGVPRPAADPSRDGGHMRIVRPAGD